MPAPSRAHRRRGFPFRRVRRGLQPRTIHAAISFAALLLATPATAQMWEEFSFADIEFRGIGIEVGPMWAVRVEPTLAYGVRVDLGLIGPRVRITPSGRFWGSRMQAREVSRLARQIILVCERQVGAECPDSLDLGEVRLSDLELSLDAHYRFLEQRPISPFLGLGLALHLLNGRGDFIDGTFVEDLLDSVAPGLAALGGVNIHLAREFRLVGEARFMLASDVRYVSIGAGGVWTLPTPSGDRAVRRSERR